MEKSKGNTLPLGEIISDEEIYPRDRVEQDNIRSMVRALEAGRSLPPLVVEKKTHILIDGEHRKRAYIAYGMDPSEQVSVEFIGCYSRSEMFLASVRRNAQHGKRLTSYDVATIHVRARSFRLKIDQCADALGMTVESYKAMTVDRFAEAKDAKDAKGSKRRRIVEPVKLKRTLSHLSGEQLTSEEVETNKKLSGMNARFYVRQVLALLKTQRLLQWDDEELVKDLLELQARLNSCVDTYVAKAS